MSDEPTVTPEPTVEPTEPAEPAPVTKEDLASAIKSIETKIGTPKAEDPYSLEGEVPPEDFSGDAGPLGDTPTDESKPGTKDALQKRVEELESDNRRLTTRSNLNELEQWIKEHQPNAFMPSIKRAVRNGSSIEVIKGIAAASNADVERGKKMLMDELGADLETIKKAANIKFEETAGKVYGQSGPPSGEQATGGMDIREYLEKIKTMNPADAEALMDQVKLGDRNPLKGHV